MSPEDVAVVELSSFQLMGMEVSPHVSVVTNLSPNHLDIHKDMEEYVTAKENVYLHQSGTDTVVLNLENTNKDISRRILDFVSGVAYAQDGKIKKVAVSTFIVTPYNVDILGDLIDELENNGVYF